MIHTRDANMTFVPKMTLAVAMILAAGLVVAPPIAPAVAQGINLMPDIQSKTPEERERERKIEEAYRARLRTIPDAQAADPWGGIRNEGAKSAKPAARANNRDVDWGALNRKP
jgi:hypothetical protein